MWMSSTLRREKKRSDLHKTFAHIKRSAVKNREAQNYVNFLPSEEDLFNTRSCFTKKSNLRFGLIYTLD